MKIFGSNGLSDPTKVLPKNDFHLTHKPQIRNFEDSNYDPQGW